MCADYTDLSIALSIVLKVANFRMTKKAAEKSYVSALCRILVQLHFRSSEQGAIKLMRRLLTRVAETIATEKDIVKELKRMAERLKAVDENPDKDLSLDEANVILGKLLPYPNKYYAKHNLFGSLFLVKTPDA